MIGNTEKLDSWLQRDCSVHMFILVKSLCRSNNECVGTAVEVATKILLPFFPISVHSPWETSSIKQLSKCVGVKHLYIDNNYGMYSILVNYLMQVDYFISSLLGCITWFIFSETVSTYLYRFFKILPWRINILFLQTIPRNRFFSLLLLKAVCF